MLGRIGHHRRTSLWRVWAAFQLRQLRRAGAVVYVAPTQERVGDFAAFLGEEFDEALSYAALRKAESIGRPVVSKEWLADMEAKTGRWTRFSARYARALLLRPPVGLFLRKVQVVLAGGGFHSGLPLKDPSLVATVTVYETVSGPFEPHVSVNTQIFPPKAQALA